jgi:hypothetical protein
MGSCALDDESDYGLDHALEPALEHALEHAMELWQNRLVTGDRAAMVATLSHPPMIALPALRPTPPRSIHAR